MHKATSSGKSARASRAIAAAPPLLVEPVSLPPLGSHRQETDSPDLLATNGRHSRLTFSDNRSGALLHPNQKPVGSRSCSSRTTSNYSSSSQGRESEEALPPGKMERPSLSNNQSRTLLHPNQNRVGSRTCPSHTTSKYSLSSQGRESGAPLAPGMTEPTVLQRIELRHSGPSLRPAVPAITVS